MSRRGDVRAVALFPAERALLLRALRELVEREGQSELARSVATMLEGAAPVDVLAELSDSEVAPAA